MVELKEDTFTFVLRLDQSFISDLDWIVTLNALEPFQPLFFTLKKKFLITLWPSQNSLTQIVIKKLGI